MKWSQHTNQHKSSGFTLIELLVTVLITAILLGLISINLGRPQTTANVTTSIDSLLNDLKSQQLLAMSGDKGSQTNAQPHGIYFQSTQYVLFAGTSYSASDSYNYTVALPASTRLTTTFPSSQVVFNTGAGDVQGFTNGSNTITLTSGTLTRTITINRLGALVVN